jgi:hypothetical protein
MSLLLIDGDRIISRWEDYTYLLDGNQFVFIKKLKLKDYYAINDVSKTG